MIKAFMAAGCAAFLATSAQAEMRFAFVESAPKDRFVIENAADCATGPIDVVIDLGGSAGALVFDTTGAGAGVEVFQPFELIAGADRVIAASPVTDGDKVVRLTLASLAAGATVAFTIDVDDQLEAGPLGQIRVAGSEIVGASATVVSATDEAIGVYDKSGRAAAAFDACLERQSRGVFDVPQRKT